MRAWGKPIPKGSTPSFEYLMGYFTVDYADLWQAELMARAYPHINSTGDIDLFSFIKSGAARPMGYVYDHPTGNQILAEIAALSAEATEALVSAFDKTSRSS